MNQPIADLHCDLLSYLAQGINRSVYDADVRCSLPQFKKGNVFFQTLAVFTETNKNSVEFAEKQFNLFQTLSHQNDFQRISNLDLASHMDQEKIFIATSIENASCLCDEHEPLDKCFSRFDQYSTTSGPIIYISMTWNHENRFGGGNLSNCGLKRDGELLLEYLNNKKTAIDLSHTSDALAYAILEYIDKKGLKLIPIASHSNFRTICDQRRNLPDVLAKEIVKRGGVIGFNFFRAFVGEVNDFIRHINYAYCLDAFDYYCFGADFFYDKDLPISLYPCPYFYPGYDNAECYPRVLRSINGVCNNKEEIEKIAYKNICSFFERLGK